MEFLEETLFGQKRAVSVNLLSLSQNISLAESRQVLSEFYENNRDRLCASYKVTVRNERNTKISINGSDDLPSEAQSITLYILAPQRASDPAVIAEISDKVRNLQLQSKISQLKSIGLCVNPLLEPAMIIASQSYLHGPLSKTLITKQKPQSREPVKAPARPSAPDKKIRNEPQAYPTVKKQKESEKQESTKELKRESQLSFAKADKSEALKSSRRPQRLPVPQRVVLGNQSQSVGLEEEDEASIAKREMEMKNLKSLYDTEYAAKQESSEGEIDDNIVDKDHQEYDFDAQMELDHEVGMNMEPIKVENAAPECNLPISTGKNHDLSGVERSSVQGGLSNKRKRTKRVLKTIITKDEEGFDVREQIYVDEEIPDVTEEGISSKFKPELGGSVDQRTNTNIAEDKDASGHKTFTSEEPKQGDTQINSIPSGSKKAKGSTKRGNQTSLMNFFRSK